MKKLKCGINDNNDIEISKNTSTVLIYINRAISILYVKVRMNYLPLDVSQTTLKEYFKITRNCVQINHFGYSLAFGVIELYIKKNKNLAINPTHQIDR